MGTMSTIDHSAPVAQVTANVDVSALVESIRLVNESILNLTRVAEIASRRDLPVTNVNVGPTPVSVEAPSVHIESPRVVSPDVINHINVAPTPVTVSVNSKKGPILVLSVLVAIDAAIRIAEFVWMATS